MTLETAIIGGLIGASFVFLYLASILDKDKYGILQVLLTFLSLVFIAVSLQTTSSLLQIEAVATTCAGCVTYYTTIADTFNILYTVMLTVITVFLLFFILRLILNALGIWTNRKAFEGG